MIKGELVMKSEKWGISGKALEVLFCVVTTLSVEDGLFVEKVELKAQTRNC